MILESIEMIIAILEDETDGVNAQLAALERSSADRLPPSVKKVLSPATDNVVARGDAPADFPILLVSMYGLASFQGNAYGNASQRDANSLPLAIAYVRRDADSAQAVRETHYVQRAVLRSLRRFMTGDASRRTLRGVSIYDISEIGVEEIRASLGESLTATGLISPILAVRDADA